MTTAETPLEFPGALLRRAGATRLDVLALEARWTGGSTRARKAFLTRLDSLDEAGLVAELQDVRDGYDGGLTGDAPMFGGTDSAHQSPTRLGGDGTEVPVETGPVPVTTTPVAPPLPVPDDPTVHDPELAALVGIDQSSEGYEEVLAVDGASVLNGGDNVDNVVAPAPGQPVNTPTAQEAATSLVSVASREVILAHARNHPDQVDDLIAAEKAGRARRTVLEALRPLRPADSTE